MNDAGSLFSLIPPIRRARGYRLYDRSGRRYLDLWQGGGDAILGHRSPGTVREMKDALSRGLLSRLPSGLQTRLERALLAMFPGYGHVRLYPCLDDALEAASSHLGIALTRADVHDPALGEPGEPAQGRGVAFWRPFLTTRGSAPRLLIPILPIGWGSGVIAALYREGPKPALQPALSPTALAGTFRALSDLPKTGFFNGRLLSALDRACLWRLRGPYLAFTATAHLYADAFRSFLKAGVLLSPEYPGPSILPQEVSEGERSLLIKLLLADTGR